MNLNINLFVHGVPFGQKIWGAKGDDQRYLSSFYGPKWDVPEVMKIDIMTFGGIPYCYYSFVKGQNVFDSQGRAGSYFALTLKVNAFYVDAQNIYNILKAAYDKICVGLCVNETNGSTKFILADFQTIDAKLKDLEKLLLGYISEFSVGNDIVTLDGFSVKSQTSVPAVNLHECTKEIATKTLKQFGKMNVSPWYLSESATQTVTKYKLEMQETTQKAQQEILLQKQVNQQKINEIVRESQQELDSVKKRAQDEINQCKEQTKIEISRIKEDHKKSILDIKNTYANVDEKLNSLQDEIRSKNDIISDLKKQYKKKENESQIYEAKIKNLKTQIDRLNSDNPQSAESEENAPKSQFKPMGLNKELVIAFAVVITLIILLAIKFLLPNEKTPNENAINSVNSEITIGFDDISNAEKVAVVGKLYRVSLKGEGVDGLNGKWVSEGFTVLNHFYIPKQDYVGKKGKLSYYVDDKEIASVEIRIINN